MINVLFLARDPGGYAAVYPVFEACMKRSTFFHTSMYCLGTAAHMNPKYASNEAIIRQWVDDNIQRIDIFVYATGFGSKLELEIVKLCRQYNIKSVAVLDYWGNYKRRFFLFGEYIFPDYFIVMDNIAYVDSMQEGIPVSIMRVLGHPGMDATIEQLANVKAVADIQETQVLILGEPLDDMNPGYTEDEFLQEVIQSAEANQLSFSIKFHPREEAWIKEKYESFSVSGNLLDIIAGSSIVVGMTTIALLHAGLLGKKAISYQPRLAIEDQCISDKLKLSTLITDYNNLTDYMAKPRKVSSNKKLLNELIWMDGKSTDRFMKFLEGL